MRVHRLLLQGIHEILASIFEMGRPADKALEQAFRSHPKWGSRDRKFVAESVYDCVRWWRKLDYVASEMRMAQPISIESRLRIFGVIRGWETAEPNPESQEDIGPGLDSTFKHTVEQTWQKAAGAPRAIRESIPDWLDQLGAEQMGGDPWEKELHALNEKAPVDLRVNTLKASVKEVRDQLRGEGIDTVLVPEVPGAISLVERKNVFVTEAFKKGWFEVQDRSSQRVAPFLDPQPGERIIDACAGAGGKSLHIATLMKNKGKVLSLDIHQWKLDELRKRASRDGIGTIELRLIESRKTIKRLKDSADRVLLDVPCTGLGVLRRNPDTKWKLNAEDYERVLALQKDLLEGYTPMAKPGGVIVYSTCSFLPAENLKQVEQFCAASSGAYSLEDHWCILPSSKQGDGFFAARIRRAPTS